MGYQINIRVMRNKNILWRKYTPNDKLERSLIHGEIYSKVVLKS